MTAIRRSKCDKERRFASAVGLWIGGCKPPILLDSLPLGLRCLAYGLAGILLFGCGVGFRLFLRRLFIFGLR